MRIVDLSVYGIWPARSAGHLAVLEPLRELASRGHEVEILSLGLRRFERRWPRRFRRLIAERLHETRLVSLRRTLAALLTGRTRFPRLDAAEAFRSSARASDLARLRSADLIVAESPWAWPFVTEVTGDRGTPAVWVAHNIEAELWEDRIRERLGEAGVARAQELERQAWHESALVIALHEDQRLGLEARYGVRGGPILVQPLGARIVDPPDADTRAAARRRLGLPVDEVIALFAASAHEPNRAAADFLAGLARGGGLGVHVLIAGSVRTGPDRFAGCTITGPLPELEDCYRAADLALNPVEQGSGMNLKVVEALARSLPVLSTPFGARGIEVGEEWGVVTAGREEFAGSLTALAADAGRRAALARAARAQAEARFGWPALAAGRERAFLELLDGRPGRAGRP